MDWLSPSGNWLTVLQREAEHRESLATTIRTLRAEESQRTAELVRDIRSAVPPDVLDADDSKQDKFKAKASELTRSLALAEAQERSLKATISGAEATIRGLKEQVQRMRATIQQVRAQCANDIRKRDSEMQKLKMHLAERQRGRRDGLTVTTININPATGQRPRPRSIAGGEGLCDPGYSLKQETNDFLTELCQNLSDENDTLINLARNTVETLKDLQGLSSTEDEEACLTGTVSLGAPRLSHGSVTSLPASCDELSAQMDRVLDHLRTLLTNPSFVPLEEVEVRDEEIKRLREGWEKMEGRWSQALTMMDGWHKRIADGGHSVQAEELRRGMSLNFRLDATQRQAEEDDEQEAAMQSPVLEDRPAKQEEKEEKKVQSASSKTNRALSDRKIKPPSGEIKVKKNNKALKEKSDNIITGRSPRKVSFTPGLQNSPNTVSPGEDETAVKAHRSEMVTRRTAKKMTESKAASLDVSWTITCDYKGQSNTKSELQSIANECATKASRSRERSSSCRANTQREREPQTRTESQGF